MRPQWVLATNNAGKKLEINAFVGRQVDLIDLQETVPSVAETGLTFVENALIKARHYAQYTDLPVLADDSGLIVPELQGAPGLYSARYAGEEASDQEHNQKLLQAMAGCDDRRAYYYCVVVLLQHALDPCPQIFTGEWHGKMLTEPMGSSGFGYDPIFFDPLLGSSAGNLSIAQKNQRSHRAAALEKCLASLVE